MIRWRHAACAACLAAALAVLASGCVTTGTKAGAGIVPLTLHLATVEPPDAPYADDMSRFSQLVDEYSQGALRVDVVWERLDWSPDSEVGLVDLLSDGGVEMAFLPARALAGDVGSGFAALQTPFLIDSPELAGAVTRSPIAERLLATVGPEGIVGLSVVFEGMRHPAGYDGQPVLGVGDYSGIGIRVAKSPPSYRLFEQLGARPGISDDYRRGADGSVLTAAESGFRWALALPHGSVMTADVSFYAKFNVLAVSSAIWEGLQEEQRSVLRRAADDVSEAAASRIDTEEEAAVEFCNLGGTLAFAGDAALAELHAAVAPLVREMEADGALASSIAGIRHLKSTVEVREFEQPGECAPASGDGAKLPSGDEG